MLTVLLVVFVQEGTVTLLFDLVQLRIGMMLEPVTKMKRKL